MTFNPGDNDDEDATGEPSELPDEEVKAWEQQPGETTKAFNAFSIYRDMGVSRSIRKVADDLKCSNTNAMRWAQRWTWFQRAQLWDAHLELARRTQKEEDNRQKLNNLEEMQIEFSELAFGSAMSVLRKAKEKLDSLDIEDIEAKWLPQYFRAAAVVAEAAIQANAQAVGVNELAELLGTRQEEE